MAVPSSSPSRSAKPQSPKPKLMKQKHQLSSKSKSKKGEINIDEQHTDAAVAIPVTAPKRIKDPGVRLVHGRIYDSQNGKTCHQCRQKTMDFTASCNNVKKGSPCPIRFCHKCLFNRYGEKAEETALLDDWHCPKCRGKCNCSFCRKKSGQKPTGILIHTAKASGFSSVSEMLDVNGPCIPDDAFASLKTALTPKKNNIAKKENQSSHGNDGKENKTDTVYKLNSQVQSPTSDLNVEKPLKRKHAQLKQASKKNTNNVGTNESSEDKEFQITEQASSLDPNNALIRKRTKNNAQKKSIKMTTSLEAKSIEKESINGVTSNDPGNGENVQIENIGNSDEPHNGTQASSLDPNNALIRKRTKNNAQKKSIKMTTSVEAKSIEKESIKINGVTRNDPGNGENVQIENIGNSDEPHNGTQKPHAKNILIKEAEVKLSEPVGNDSITIGGTELPSGDVGQALQFLEFCAAFGKLFNMRKGQAEVIIREIVVGRERRRAQYSAAIQFHMELISLIQKGSGEICSELSPKTGKNSWLHAAWKCISSSNFQNSFTNFATTSEGYNDLDSSVKLMLLNFLCDEALNTEKLRSWIEEEYSRSLEQEREAKEKVAAAKENQLIAKRKMQDELAKAIIAKNGAPLTISEHETIVSQIKSEAEEAHTQMLEAKGALPNNKPRSDAVRTEHLFLDTNGNTFWRLKSCPDELGLLLQETKETDGIVQNDHWISFDAEQISSLEKYIHHSKQQKKQKVIAFSSLL